MLSIEFIRIKKILNKFPCSGFIKKRAGIVLLSHTATCAIPSPLTDFTAEFGMGSGVSPSL
jgi:hypothetical protein